MQQFIKFGLPDQHDLQQLLLFRFKIRQHPDLFQRSQRKVLTFIDEQHRIFTRGKIIEQECIQCIDIPFFRLTFLSRSDPELCRDGFQEIQVRHIRIQN